MAAQLLPNDFSRAPGLSMRAARWGDLEAVAHLIHDVCTADGDPSVALSLDDLRADWQKEGFDPARDAWVVHSAGGHIVGYEQFWDRNAHAALSGDGYVHPDFKGRGIGTALLQALDRRARQELELAEPDLRVFIRNYMFANDANGRSIHEAQGYQPVRFSWRMEIALQGPPAGPVWPEGVVLKPFLLQEHNRKVFEADDEVFHDHWGIAPLSFADWQLQMTSGDDFDPGLWFVAWDGSEIAGYCLCRLKSGIGWVGELGVRRPWRKQGLGLALLLHAFGDFYKRGMHTIGLVVDAANLTGATRLYQKAGMHVVAQFAIYEKEYRPGRNPEVA